MLIPTSTAGSEFQVVCHMNGQAALDWLEGCLDASWCHVCFGGWKQQHLQAKRFPEWICWNLTAPFTARQDLPDIILLDAEMKGLTGYEARTESVEGICKWGLPTWNDGILSRSLKCFGLQVCKSFLDASNNHHGVEMVHSCQDKFRCHDQWEYCSHADWRNFPAWFEASGRSMDPSLTC